MADQTPRRKALNTLLQGIAIDVAVALVVGLALIVESANSWADLGAGLVAFSFAKSLLVAALTYLMRNYVDRWRVALRDTDVTADPVDLED